MSLQNKINTAVIGATGYTGLDLIFILSKHPKIDIKYLCATKNLGKKISYFDKRIKKNLPKISSANKIEWNKLDLVFLSLPNGEAQKLIKKIFFKYKNLKFIDLSADFRLTNGKIYKENYKITHKAKNLINKSIYSVPELKSKMCFGLNNFIIAHIIVAGNPVHSLTFISFLERFFSLLFSQY